MNLLGDARTTKFSLRYSFHIGTSIDFIKPGVVTQNYLLNRVGTIATAYVDGSVTKC